MSKCKIIFVISATLAMAACAGQAPQPDYTPMPEPVFVEPASTKG
jgi:hypothetical protein